MSNSRGEANLVMRCKFCKRESTARKRRKGGNEKRLIHPHTHFFFFFFDCIEFDTSSKVTSYNTSGKFEKIAVFDVRGLELVDFSPRVSEEGGGA
jgi:hypothetical protein